MSLVDLCSPMPETESVWVNLTSPRVVRWLESQVPFYLEDHSVPTSYYTTVPSLHKERRS